MTNNTTTIEVNEGDWLVRLVPDSKLRNTPSWVALHVKYPRLSSTGLDGVIGYEYPEGRKMRNAGWSANDIRASVVCSSKADAVKVLLKSGVDKKSVYDWMLGETAWKHK